MVRNKSLRSLLLAVVAIGLSPNQSTCIAEPAGTRNKSEIKSAGNRSEPAVTLDFPTDRSLGKLYKLDLRFPSGPSRLTPSMEARGRVTVPASCKLQLAPSYSGAEDLSPLRKLKTDNIFMIDASHLENFNDKCLEQISALSSVKVLFLDETNITDKGLHWVGKMQQLIALAIQQANVTDAGLAELQHLKSLQRLRLDYVRLDNTSIKFLSGLTNLDYLNLSSCGMNDEMMKSLKPLTALHTLHLSGNNITDRGVECLTNLPNLWIVDLQHTEVTSACAKSLKNQRHLSELSVTLDEKAGRELAKQLPHTKVSTKTTPPIPVEVFAPLK